MAKRKTQKISSRNKPAKKKPSQINPVEKKLPDGHRYDTEISGIAYVLLAKAYSARPIISIEKSIKSDLKKLIASRKISRVASDYYQGVLDLAAKDPLSAVCTKMIEVTNDEYVLVSKHMKKLEDISMLGRIDNLMNILSGKEWFVDCYNSEGLVLPDEPFLCFTLHEHWKESFNEAGELTGSLSVMARTENVYDLVESAYECGVLLFKQSVTAMHFHLKVYPANNIPGVALKPRSVMKVVTK